MSYYAKNQPVRLRMCFDPKERFPEKLYDVANDNFLIKWNTSGDSVVVEPELFTQHVMKCYPGFVQISSFPNLRRLFRQYGFDWKINPDDTFEFSQECFERNHRDLLDDIVTRRKSYQVPKIESRTRTNRVRVNLFETKEHALPYLRRRRCVRKSTSQHSSYDFDDNNFVYSRSPVKDTYSGDVSPSPKQTNDPPKPELDLAVMDLMIKNELSDEEFLRLLHRRDDILRRFTQFDEAPSKGCEWMYKICEQTDIGCDNAEFYYYSSTVHEYDNDMKETLCVSESFNCEAECKCVCHNSVVTL